MDSALATYIYSYGGAAGLCLILLLTGLLVLGPEHKRAIAQNEKLQAANDKLMETNADLLQQNTALTSGGQLTNQLVTALITLSHEHQPAASRAAPDPGSAPAREGA